MPRPEALVRATLTVSLLTLCAVPARADAIEDFYRDKTVSIVVSTGPAGSYAMYAQLMMREMQKHLPGAPKLVPVYMPGGGGTKAANYLYNVSQKDGTAVAMLSDYTVNGELLRPEAVKYKSDKFNWIGLFVASNPVIVVMRESGVRSLDDAKKRELVMASTGKSAPSYINMSMMNALFGTKFKIITGYKDRSTVEHAMDRGEVVGSSAGWLTWTSGKPDWVESGRIVPLVQVGLERLSQLKDVPMLLDLARNDEERALLTFVSAGGALGRSVTSPPEVPQERVTALRRAFDAMVKDPTFIAEAKKRLLDLDPKSGEWLQQMVSRAVQVSPAVVARARTAMGDGGN